MKAILRIWKPILLVAALAITLLLGLKQSFFSNLFVSSNEKLMRAVISGNLESVKILEVKGVNLNQQYRMTFGWTPLMASIYMQQTNVTEYLLAKNVNVNLMDNNGRTALVWAITANETNIVRILLEKGAFVSTRGLAKQAFSAAELSPHREVLLEWLNQYKKDGKTN